MTTNKKQEKLQQSITDITAQIVYEKHLYHIGLTKSKPSYNQLYRVCAEYINLGLQNIKSRYNMEILPIKDKNSIQIDERFPNIMKMSIVEYAVYQYSFYIVRGSKRRYTITASGTIKEGSAAKLPEEFVSYYIALCGIVNELLEYGCMMALNKLHHTGTLYIDVPLMELLDEVAIEQTTNDAQDTNNNIKVQELYNNLTQIINVFIIENVEMLYGLNTEAQHRPYISVEFVEANNGSDIAELMYDKGVYSIVRNTGNPIDEQKLGTIGRFINAVDVIFSEKVKEIKKNV